MLKFLCDKFCRAFHSLEEKLMKTLLHMVVLGCLLVSFYARADDDKQMPSHSTASHTMDEKKHKGGQQEKMKRCNAEAKGMKGEERKSKMSACLKG
jgi:hypothetical protein